MNFFKISSNFQVSFNFYLTLALCDFKQVTSSLGFYIWSLIVMIKKQTRVSCSLGSEQMFALSSPLACILLGENTPLLLSSPVSLFCSLSFSPCPSIAASCRAGPSPQCLGTSHYSDLEWPSLCWPLSLPTHCGVCDGTLGLLPCQPGKSLAAMITMVSHLSPFSPLPSLPSWRRVQFKLQ